MNVIRCTHLLDVREATGSDRAGVPGLLPVTVVEAFCVTRAELLLDLAGFRALLLLLLLPEMFGAAVLEALLGVVDGLLEGQVGSEVGRLFFYDCRSRVERETEACV